MSGVSSIQEKFIGYAATDMAASDPMDVWTAHTVINNVAHCADTVGQALIAWSRTNGDNGPGGSSDSEVRGGLRQGEWDLLALFGPMLCRVGSDRLPYPQRARLALETSGSAATAEFRLVVGALDGMGNDMLLNGNNVISVEVPMPGTVGWKASGLLEFNSQQFNACKSDRETTKTLGSTELNSVDTCEMYAGVYLNVPEQVATFYVAGLGIAEWVGL